MFDETGFVKKGKDSVGVARQYCGTLGKVENCQVGVFAGYASRQGYALVDKRLFLPEVWWTDAYAARRTRCNVPDELTFQSKPQLAAAMLQAIAQEGLLPFKYVVADCLYGNSPDFLDAVDACVGRHGVRGDPVGDALLAPAPPDGGQDATGIREKCARSAWWWPRTRPAHGGGVGGEPARLQLVSAHRSQKGPRGRSCMRLPANA